MMPRKRPERPGENFVMKTISVSKLFSRFGLGGGGGGGGGGAAAGGNKKLGEAPAVDADTLKKRADRFGGSVSSSLKNIEVQEAIKRRQERFGVVEKNEPKPKKVSLNKSENSVVLDEKMKARQQRFGNQL